MKIPAILAMAMLLVGVSVPALGAAPYKNLKVLKDNGKTLKKGMKDLTKGLGVKCKACHVKGRWDDDKVTTKDKTRAFFRAVVGIDDAAKRKAALAELLQILKLDAPKDAARLWKGIANLERK